MSDFFIQDFIVYMLENDGTYAEVEMEFDKVGEHLNSADVWLMVRQDLRRLFIWKGPTSPVRKRFISSRVAAEIQENLRKGGGRHLKIVSCDAGDEPIEFLSAFDLEPYEVTEQLQDMRYTRNIDREKEKQDALKKKLEARKKKKAYTSPLLKEAQEKGNLNLDESVDVPEIKKVSAPPPEIKKVSAPPPKKKVTPKPKAKPKSTITRSESLDYEEILKRILDNEPPNGLKRMNIIIEGILYSPAISTSKVLGKTIEKETWMSVTELPDSIIDMESKIIRFFSSKDKTSIEAIELYEGEPEKKNSSSKRKLPSVPGA